MESIRELLIEDLYDAEKQLVKALPKMAKAAANEQLREAFENYLEQTRGHVARLEQAFQLLDQKASARLGYYLRRSKGGALRDFRLWNTERLGTVAGSG
jgi:bacterioferritin (cytochrome b1)